MSSNDRDNTCVKVHATLCVSATDVDKVKTTHAHKDKPSKFREQIRKRDIAINMSKTTVGQTSEKEVRHVEEPHEMNFCLTTCMLLKIE